MPERVEVIVNAVDNASRNIQKFLDKIPTNEPDLFEDCDYCGNTSDIMDARGNCPACGAKRKKKDKKVFPSMRFEYAYGVSAMGSTSESPPYWIAST